MAKLKTIFKIILNPSKMIKPLGHKGFFNFLPDRIYLKLVYRAETGKKLNLDEPECFTEKLQWLKLYNRKLEYSMYVDKYKVRSYIADKIGEKHLIPLVDEVYTNVDDIKWDKLPMEFVIKCNHGSGTNIICKDKSKLNIDMSKKKLKKWMKKSWYSFGREWPYKSIEKKIIVEKLLYDKNQATLNDYKFWVFNGEVKYINVHFKIKDKTIFNIYNLNWELQNFGMVYENDASIRHEKPINLNQMIIYAEKLAYELPFVRVDFYEVNNQVYFGEITFYPTSGFIKFHPNHNELDRKYGKLLSLDDLVE